MPTPDPADLPEPGDVAVALTEEVWSVIRFGSSVRQGHPDSPDWTAERRMLPEHLWRAIEQLETADHDVSWIGHEYAQSLQGVAYNERGLRVQAARQVSAKAAEAALREVQTELASALQDAKARAVGARATVEATSEETRQEMWQLDRRIVSAWMKKHSPVLERLHAEFLMWFGAHRRALDGLGVDRRVTFGGRTRNSACEIVGEVAGEVVALLKQDEPPGRAAFDALLLPWNEWEDLSRSVRNEVALVATLLPRDMPSSAPPPPVERGASRPMVQLSVGAPAPRAAQLARESLHKHVMDLAGNISNVLILVERYPEGIGLHRLRQHTLGDSTDPEPATPEESAQWRCTIGLVRAHLAEASRLWEQDTSGENTRLHLDFDRIGQEATCGPLYNPTFHGLLILVARVLLDPTAMPPYALAEIADAPGSLTTLQWVMHKRVIEALTSRQWWRQFSIEIAREYATVLGLAPVGHFEAVLPDEPTPIESADGSGVDAAESLENKDPPMSPVGEAPAVLRFRREPEAKQNCLAALDRAPDGIPSHDAIAGAIGLAVQTVKEAMAKLSQAGHVHKIEGAWRITDKGRDFLRSLRGQ